MRKNEQRLKNIFRADWYRRSNRDVEEAGIDPWEHFISAGLAEGRSPNPLFDLGHFPETVDTRIYDGATVLDYLNGLYRAVPCTALFDLDWYRSQAGRTIEDGESDLEHYLRLGADAGCEPCPLFISSEFRNNRPAFMTPLEDFVSDRLAWEQPIGVFFSGSSYLGSHPDVKDSGINPLVHFILTGQDPKWYQNPLVDDEFAKKWLPEAQSYSDIVAALRSGRAISPEHISPDPLAQQLINHALRSDSRKSNAWASASECADPEARWFAYLEQRATAIRLPEVESPRVSVIVPTYNDSAMTLSCLEALADSSIISECEVIVVDDGSSPELVDPLNQVRNILLVRKERNEGYSAAVASGVSASSGDLIFLHNNDAVVLDHALEELLIALDSAADLGAAGGLVLDAEQRVQEAGCAVFAGGFAHQYGNGQSPLTSALRYPRDVDYCSAVGLMVRRSTWDDVGGYSSEYKPAYYEDADLCMKIWQTSSRVRFVPGAVVLHQEGSSHGTSLHGIKAFQYRNRRLFAEAWAEALSGRPRASELTSEDNGAHLWFDRQSKPDILIVDHQIPDPTMDAGSVRMAEIVKLLNEGGHLVHFVGLGNLARSTWSFSREAAHTHWETDLDGLARALRMIRSSQPMVVLSRPDIYARSLPIVLDVLPDARIAFDSVDALGRRLEQELEVALDSHPGKVAKAKREFAAALRLERLAVRSADCVISVSALDTEYFRQIDAAVPIVEIPMIHHPVNELPAPEGRDGVLFVGGYRHPPNVDAAIYLAEEVMPLVWKNNPNVTLTLAGSHPPEEVQALAGPRTSVPGWVESLDHLYTTTRVVVAPVRYGAGVNGKITEALSLGLPVVTTSVGAKNAGLKDGSHVLVGDEPNEIASHIVHLLHEPALWRSLSEGGHQICNTKFGVHAGREGLSELLRILMD